VLALVQPLPGGAAVCFLGVPELRRGLQRRAQHAVLLRGAVDARLFFPQPLAQPGDYARVMPLVLRAQQER
jgi:hypothetical protein